MPQESDAADRPRRHKAVIGRFYEELWNRWDYSVVGELLTGDVAFHGSLGVSRTGHAGFIEYAELVRAAFPDFHNTVEDLIAEGDKVAACLTYRGTHMGEIFGIPPTGRAIRYIGTAIFVFRAGLIAHAWVLGDRLDLLQQLSDRDPAGGC